MRITFIFLSVFLLCVLVSCGQRSEKKLEIPSPEEYRSWMSPTDAPLNYPVPGHRDNCRIIYINPIGESVKISEQNGRASYEYPEGTIIIKEIYKGLEEPEEGEEPIELTIMIKAPKHLQARQGWIWIVKGFAAESPSVVRRNFCADCHANANEAHPYGDRNSRNEFRDFVYFPPHTKLKETAPVETSPAYTDEYY